jgi:hypothetical protein
MNSRRKKAHLPLPWPRRLGLQGEGLSPTRYVITIGVPIEHAPHADWSETVPLFEQRHVSQFIIGRDGGQFTKPGVYLRYSPQQKAHSE